MSELLFKRRYSLTVGTTKLTDLRVEFNVRKNLQKEPNKAEVKIYNLSAVTRKLLQGKGIPVILSAGYESNEGVIFSGDSRVIQHTHEGPNWITKVESGDGEKAFQFSRFSNSYGPGTPVAQVIRDVVASTSLNPGNLNAALALPFRSGFNAFANGYAAHGDSVDVLGRLLKTIGFTFSIQGGTLQVLKSGNAVAGSAYLLSPSTGLVGSPEFGTPEKKGAPAKLSCKSLLNPKIICGGVVEIKAENVTGQFKVEHLEHSGDSASSEWYTKVEVKPI